MIMISVFLNINLNLNLNIIFTGHGERSAISFETKYAEIYAMDVKTLKSLLEASQTSSRTKIVVVSACHSEEAGKTFIEAGNFFPCSEALRHQIVVYLYH
jgi:hypothetical protein